VNVDFSTSEQRRPGGGLAAIRTDEELEEWLSRPAPADIDLMRRLRGDVLILGAGGKMGPSLVRRVARAREAAGGTHRIRAVSRFSSPDARAEIERTGAEAIACDLLAREDVMRLPDAEHVWFLAGRKFGTTDRVDLTWAANALVPAHVIERFAGARVVVFSTGNVYPFVPVSSNGARETDPTGPVGEYAQSCLARERIFEYAAREHGTRVLIYRLNYAVDLRYGVLVDIARAVHAGQPVDLTVGHLNCLWQGDANSYALRAIDLCDAPARVLNVTGADRVAVRDAAAFFGSRFGRPPQFRGSESSEALLSDASLCQRELGPPEIGTADLMDAVANWVAIGGRGLGKPTHFGVTDGRF
jgi:nucleoside-diphosphate-sugar epimerase